jgi:hypothetical protein
VSDAPTVSVCIPVCECERFIGATIRSVLEQTFGDFGLVVLDNASRDRTPATGVTRRDLAIAPSCRGRTGSRRAFHTMAKARSGGRR